MKVVKLFRKAEHKLGESIIWHAAQRCLLWIDLMAPELFRHDFKSGRTESWPLDFAPPIGAIAATEDPDILLLSHRGGLSLLRISDRSTSFLCDPEAGRDGIIYNDLKCDRWGRAWAGTSHALERDPRGALWCVAGKHAVLGDAGFAVSNGPAFSLDGRTLFFNDTVGRQMLAYDISGDDMHPRNRRVIRTFDEEEGVPDGVISDAEGDLWVAHWGGAQVSRMTVEGKVVARYPVPALNVTTMCFAGPDYTTLYIITAREGMDEASLAAMPLSGSVFVMETDSKGTPEPLMKLG
jgi:sugar lactone lactonase YvrE